MAYTKCVRPTVSARHLDEDRLSGNVYAVTLRNSSSQQDITRKCLHICSTQIAEVRHQAVAV
jgi:hypothetical protein